MYHLVTSRQFRTVIQSFVYHACCIFLLLGIAFNSACEKKEQNIIATIGEQQITKKQLEESIRKYKAAFVHTTQPETVTPAELKRFILDQLIDNALIAREGRKRGLAVKGESREQLIRKTMIELGRKVNYPSNQEALEYYRKHKKLYLVHTRYDISQILVADEHLAWELKEKIEKHRLSMGEAAKKYSLGEEASAGGHLEPMKLKDFIADLAKVIPHLKPGQLSPVIHTPYGYHLLQLNRILPAGLEPFATVQNKVKDELYAQKLREHFKQWLAEARIHYRVTINESELEAVNEK